MGWDVGIAVSVSAFSDFNPPTPCGVGQELDKLVDAGKLFQSTHPVWGGTFGFTGAPIL